MPASATCRSRHHGRGLLFLLLCAMVGLLVAAGTDPALGQTAGQRELTPSDRFLVVDCLLPGQLRRIGGQASYLTARRAVKTSISDCEVRGGEYVAYDRADYGTALNIWMPGAERGDKEAQTYVGEIYEKGISGVPDYATAAAWYTKAAAQNHPRALINLGYLHEQGLGVEKDPAKALELYRRASGLGELIALQEPVGEAQDQIRALQQELDQTRRELEQARQELERQRGNSQSELEQLKRDRDAAVSAGNLQAVKQLEAQVRQREGEIDRQGKEVARLERLVDAYRNQLERVETDRGTLQQQVAALQDQMSQAQAQLERSTQEADAGKQEVEAYRAEIDQLRKQATSNQDRERLKAMEAALQRKQEEAARQSREISRLEQEARRYREELSRLEKQSKAEAPPQPVVAIAPPSIQLIDPPIVTVRGKTTIKVRGMAQKRELVGKVIAPAGLLSFTVNDRTESVDENGLFKTTIEMFRGATPVTLIAVDKHGKRAVLDFSLVPEQLAKETTVATSPSRKGPMLREAGEYYAIVIGNQEYDRLPDLDTPVNDAKVISDLLRKRYGFKVTTLINANRYQILSELNKARAKLTDKDNLLIYYAGHGELDRANLRAHWLPVDAEEDSDANWISSVAITDVLNAMSVKHVLVVADSCYSGAMTRASIGQLDSGMSEDARLTWLRALAKARSRTVLTSGGVQPVIDSGGGKHSVFAKSLIEVLSQNDDVLEGQRLYQAVSARVLDVALKVGPIDQRPEYAPLKYAGHESGDFLFVPAN